jgi:AcrR family transcriptional regulator
MPHPPVDLLAEPDPTPEARRLARKSRRQDNRRQQILHAAREVLLESGPDAFTMEQVARAADTSKAALYYYFRAKEEVIAALAIEALRREVEALSRVVIAAERGVDGLVALIRARVEHYLADPDAFRILYSWAPTLGAAQRLALAEILPLTAVVTQTLEARLQRDRKAGHLHPHAHPAPLAQVAGVNRHGLLTYAMSRPDDASWRPLCDEACAALLRGARA